MSQQGTSGIEMRLGSGSGEAKDITPLVRRFVWSDSLLAGGFSWKMTFTTEEWSEWNKLLLGEPNPVVRFRLYSQDGNVTKTTDWRTAVTDVSRSGFRGTVMYARAEGADRRLDLRQKVRTRAFPNSSVADVVTAVAGEHNLTPVIDGKGPARDRWQLREDNWTYIMRLAREHATDSQRGDVFLWVDEDTIRLGSPKIAGIPATRRHEMSEVESRVDRHIVSYAGRKVDRAGGATLVGIGYDFDAAAPLTFTMDANAAQTQPALARRVPRKPDDGLRVFPITESAASFVQNITRARWGRTAPRYFTLRVDTRPDVLLRPGVILEMNANLDDRRQTPLHGRFVVLEVVHDLLDSSIRTTAVCYRREAYEGQEDPTGSAAASGGSRDNYRTGQPDLPRVVLVAQEIPS